MAHFWNDKHDHRMRQLAEEGIPSSDVAEIMGVKYCTLDYHARKEGVKFQRKEMKGIPKPRLEDESGILTYNTTDPRAYHCQQITICNGDGCYRKNSCPAHEKYNNKHAKVGVMV